MNTKLLLLPTVALGMAAFLLSPSKDASAFSKLGGSLDVSQRDFRVFNNFADDASNNNVRGSAEFPGFLAAEQAIWKGSAEWNSSARGGDITQAGIGDGQSNFEAFFAGNTTSIGSTDDNIVSALSTCNGGVIAFTEIPIADGWRIRFCDDKTFSDGPGPIPGHLYDLQGIMTHEYGHALGLGHSTVGNATMYPVVSTGQVIQRSINFDDIAGLQCLYGSLSGSKPMISGVSVSGGSITITGSGFDTAATNEVWFTHRNVTASGGDPRVRVFNVSSTGGGTSITVAIPGDAGAGEVAVKTSGSLSSDLSNTFPTDLGEPFFGGSVFSNGSGSNPPCFMSTSLPQLGQTLNMQVDASAHPGGAGFSGVLIYAGSALIPTVSGELLVDLSSPQYGFLGGSSSGGIDLYSSTPVPDPSFLGATATAQGFTFSLSVTVLCNAENLTLGAAP
ncbi:MAG: hypothetical protein CMJ89_11155 [Planctomycetes bacterium]|jgi:hypothetical protein|nr:hypothetical protein [Planctomycetota bacterium]